MAATRTFETSTIGLTHARNLLAPTTAIYALPFGAYYLLLSQRVVAQRHASNRSLGEGTAPCCPGGICAKSGSAKVGKSTDIEEVDPLFVATRAHANFVENVPMAMMLAGLAELNGGDRRVIGGALAGLLILRIAHVECGMKCKGAEGKGRLVGYYGTQVWLAGMALYGALLVKDYQGFCSAA